MSDRSRRRDEERRDRGESAEREQKERPDEREDEERTEDGEHEEEEQPFYPTSAGAERHIEAERTEPQPSTLGPGPKQRPTPEPGSADRGGRRGRPRKK